jgi:hypothetical protein
MAQSEPPSSISCSRYRLFFVGRDHCGNWVVQDQQHLCGGLFIDLAPSTNSSMPVTKLESSEARKRTAVAISRGWPMRPIGMIETNWSLTSFGTPVNTRALSR